MSSDESSDANRPLRVLMLTPMEPSPPIGGARTVYYGDLELLASRGHEVRVLALTQREDLEAGTIDGLAEAEYFHQPDGSRVLQLLTNQGRALPYSITRRRNQALQARAQALVAAHEVDVLLVQELAMAEYAPRIAAATPVATYLRGHTVTSNMAERFYRDAQDPLRRLLAWRQYRKFVAFETAMARSFDAVSQISQVDAEAFGELTGRTDVTTIFPSMDLDHYSPGPFEERDADTLMSCCTLEAITTLPAMLWFYDEVWPLVRERCPQARFEIAGRATPSKLDDVRDERFTLHGPVDDMLPYLRRGGVFVSTMFAGSGIRLSLLNAMATGNAVVATSVSAEGVPCRDGEDLLIRDHPEGFCDAVCTLLENEAERRRMGEAARGRMTGGLFDFDRNALRLEADLREAMRRNSGSATR